MSKLKLLLLLFVSSPAMAMKIPVQLFWQSENLQSYAPSNIEVSEDAAYKKILARSPLADPQSYYWVAPKEGAYHFRLMNSKNKNILNGSFLALGASWKPQRVKISWAKIKGATRYEILVFESGRDVRRLETIATSFSLYKGEQSTLIQVSPIGLPKSLHNLKTYNHGLRLDDGTKPDLPDLAPPPPPAATQEARKANENRQVAEAMASMKSGVNPLSLEKPYAWNIYSGYRGSQETLTVDRLDRSISSTSSDSGGVVGASGHAFGPVYLSGLVSYYQSAHHLRKDGGNPESGFRIDENRLAVRGMAGLNLLAGMNTSRHALLLQGGGVYRELPQVPFTQDEAVQDEAIPTADARMFGVGSTYIFTSIGHRFDLSAAYFGEFEGTGEAGEVRAHWDVIFGYGLSLKTGLFYSISQLGLCDSVEESCPIKNMTKSQEAGGILAAGWNL